MALAMQLVQVLQLKQEQELKMTLTDEMMAADSIIPDTLRWLNESADHQWAIHRIAADRQINRYKCTADLLVGELCGIQFRHACRDWYADKGPRLKEAITDRTQLYMDKFILYCCKRAYELHVEDRKIVWFTFRKKCYAAFEAAA